MPVTEPGARQDHRGIARVLDVDREAGRDQRRVARRQRDGLVDRSNLRIVDEAYRPVGRLYANGYARQNDRFELVRESVEEWQARKDR